MAKTFTDAQRRNYTPPPCEECGSPCTKPEWVYAGQYDNEDMWKPGLRSCTKPGCRYSNAPAGIGGNDFPDCPVCGSGVTGFTNDREVSGGTEWAITVDPCGHHMTESFYYLEHDLRHD